MTKWTKPPWIVIPARHDPERGMSVPALEGEAEGFAILIRGKGLGANFWPTREEAEKHALAVQPYFCNWTPPNPVAL